MIGLNYEQIIEKIKKEKGLEESGIKERIDEKLKQLGDLVSLEGAAHIVCHELGVKVYEDARRVLKINEVVAGITSVDIIGKVVNVYGVREFNKNNRQGKVGSLLIGDESGVMRVAIWDNNLIQHIESGALREGRIIEVKNGYVKENNGLRELHLGSRASIVFDAAENIEVKQKSVQQRELKKIGELNPGENVAVNGYVVQVFEPRFYDACGGCYKKVRSENGKLVCEEHGETVARKIPILNFYLDDGSGNIRVVAFRENVNKILPGLNNENFEGLRDGLMGKLMMLSGKVVRNEMFDRDELIVNDSEDVDADKLVEEAAG